MQTPTEQFAGKYRLHVRRAECGEQIIPGKRGHLYFDGDSLCLMVTDAKPAQANRWEACGGNWSWTGDISPDKTKKRVQDVWIRGITDHAAAIRMCGIKTIRVMSEAQREGAIKGLLAARNRNATP